jgi:hypothetical protein
MPAKKPPLTSLEEFGRQYGDKMHRDGECLIWTGAKGGTGYGMVNRDGRAWHVHRILYELQHGPLPPKWVVDHICRNRACVELTHLRACTHKDNMRHRASLPSNNTSGARGVSLYRAGKTKPWEAHITVDDKKLYLGRYETFNEAKDVVTAARERHFGKYAGVA